ncbi:lantibiotic dehydratase, partial [Streptomyces bohaiensis]
AETTHTPLDHTRQHLTELARHRWITWRLDIPSGPHPEQQLRTILNRINDPHLRNHALTHLNTLEDQRTTVHNADRNPHHLTQALHTLETHFTDITHTASQRNKSTRTAPNRSLLYTDTRRSTTATIGHTILDAMAPLGPLLDSAAWLMAELATVVRREADEVFDQLAASVDGEVDLGAFWLACMPVLHGGARSAAEEVAAEFRRRWAHLLPLPTGARRVRIDGSDLAAGVAAEFPAAAPGWTAARYVSPDVLVVADSTGAVARGDFSLVLGEMHLATNTMAASLFVSQHPDPAELFTLTDRDHPAPRLLPMLPKEHSSRLSVRVQNVLVRPEDYLVALRDQTADPYRPRTVLSADASVVRRGGRLLTVLPDGAEFDVLDVFGHVLTTLAMDLFRLFPDADHVPRVTIDRMTVQRESWRFTG